MLTAPRIDPRRVGEIQKLLARFEEPVTEAPYGCGYTTAADLDAWTPEQVEHWIETGERPDGMVPPAIPERRGVTYEYYSSPRRTRPPTSRNKSKFTPSSPEELERRRAIFLGLRRRTLTDLNDGTLCLDAFDPSPYPSSRCTCGTFTQRQACTRCVQTSFEIEAWSKGHGPEAFEATSFREWEL